MKTTRQIFSTIIGRQSVTLDNWPLFLGCFNEGSRTNAVVGDTSPYLFNSRYKRCTSLPFKIHFKHHTIISYPLNPITKKNFVTSTTNNEGGGSEEFGKEKEVLFTERSWEVSEQEERKVLHYWEMYYYASLCTRVILINTHICTHVYIELKFTSTRVCCYILYSCSCQLYTHIYTCGQKQIK